MRRVIRLQFLSVLSVLALLGCREPPTLSMTLDRSDAVLLRGNTVTIGIDIQHNQTAEPIAVTVEGLPPGVTADFEYGWESSAGAGIGMMPPLPRSVTLSASADASLGPAIVSVVATGEGTARAVVALELNVQALVINGRVEFVAGLPLSGLTVVVSGLLPTTTATDGTFTIEAAPSPYDLTVASESPATRLHPRVAQATCKPYGPAGGDKRRRCARSRLLLCAQPRGPTGSVSRALGIDA